MHDHIELYNFTGKNHVQKQTIIFQPTILGCPLTFSEGKINHASGGRTFKSAPPEFWKKKLTQGFPPVVSYMFRGYPFIYIQINCPHGRCSPCFRWLLRPSNWWSQLQVAPKNCRKAKKHLGKNLVGREKTHNFRSYVVLDSISIHTSKKSRFILVKRWSFTFKHIQKHTCQHVT